VALSFVGVELMRGGGEPPPEKDGEKVAPRAAPPTWRSVLFMPVTFPLTVGGTTFAIFVSFRSMARNLPEIIALSIAGLAYAMVPAITVYASGHLERRVTPKTRTLLEKVAGILLTAIAVMLLSGGFSRMVVSTLDAVKAEKAQKDDQQGRPW
jgi:multiple antibiotic resistance protein